MGSRNLVRSVSARSRLEAAIPQQHAFRCAEGHAVVVYFDTECPVCAVTRRTGYSDKWCDHCREITAHVGGLHINATCLRCLSHRQLWEME